MRILQYIKCSHLKIEVHKKTNLLKKNRPPKVLDNFIGKKITFFFFWATQAAAAHELFPLKEPFLFKSRYVISNSSEIKLSEENPQAPHNPQ